MTPVAVLLAALLWFLGGSALLCRSTPFWLDQSDFIPWRVTDLEEKQEEKVQSQKPACKRKQPSSLQPMHCAATLTWVGSVPKTKTKRDVKSKKTKFSFKKKKNTTFFFFLFANLAHSEVKLEKYQLGQRVG